MSDRGLEVLRRRWLSMVAALSGTSMLGNASGCSARSSGAPYATPPDTTGETKSNAPTAIAPAIAGTRQARPLHTTVCAMFGIEHPLLQAGMGAAAGPDMAAAVSSAGGLGIASISWRPPDKAREVIHTVRAQTDKPFGVNLIVAPELVDPPSGKAIKADALARMHRVLNPIRRELGLPTSSLRPTTYRADIRGVVDVVFDEKPAVLNVALGVPEPYIVEGCKKNEIKLVAMVATVDEAKQVERAGVDAVIVQGAAAGGHRAHFSGSSPERFDAIAMGTMPLVRETIAAVDIPVIAAGGITDGAGLVAALALGADGVLMGTRFAATKESIVPEEYKRALLEAGGNATMATKGIGGRWTRVLKNRLAEVLAGANVPVFAYGLQHQVFDDVKQEAIKRGQTDLYPLWAGQGVGNVTDLPGAAEVVAATIGEAEAVLRERFGA